MEYDKNDLAALLAHIDLGSSIAELDGLLETARVETSVFTDLLSDKIDLIPGTKGSGKSALFRIFVDFLPEHLLKNKKVVIAHGVQKHGDSVFHAFKDQFEQLSEDQFISFWCIYFVSLVHEQFIKGEMYTQHLKSAGREIQAFKQTCAAARIPEIPAKKSLLQILEWVLYVLKANTPKLSYQLPEDCGEITLDLFGKPSKPPQTTDKDDKPPQIPSYASQIKDALESVLDKSGLSIWLLVDRLDEIFPRRSEVEAKALRGLLRSMRLFTSDTIRIKVFLRDDMFENLLSSGNGFTAFTHITARQADTLNWSEDQILTMIVKRFFANRGMIVFYGADAGRLEASLDYRKDLFYTLFPQTVHRGTRQSSTLRWICSHTADARGVVTPRDVIDLFTKAKQHQQDIYTNDSSGTSSYLIGSASIQYGLLELAKRKRTSYLQAEFPHLWQHISKFSNGKSEHSTETIAEVLGPHWRPIVDDLKSIGVIEESRRKDQVVYKFPDVYRIALGLTRGRAQ